MVKYETESDVRENPLCRVVETTVAAVIVLAAGFVLLAFCGCTFVTKNYGEFGFKQTTSWSFFHDAKQTGSIPSESSTQIPTLEEWLHRKAMQPAPIVSAVPTGPNMTTAP